MLYVFDDCILDTALHELHHQGHPVPLEPKGYQVLVYLVAHRDRLVTKDELLGHVWPGVYVTDTTVARCLTLVRKAVGDSGAVQRVIKTMHGQGYRFVAPVTVLAEVPSDAPMAPAATPWAPEIAEVHRCRACQRPSAASAQFCSTCGTPLEVIFPLQPLHTGSSALPHVDMPSPSDTLPLPADERKTVTVLSGIVSPGLSLLPGLDLDDRHALVGRLETLVREAVQPYAGTLQHLRSDRFTVVFGAPQAQEDHAQRAILAALTIQRQWPTFAAACPAPPAAPLALGLGVHTGHIVVSPSGDTPARTFAMVGDVLLLADFLAQHAIAGAILARAATAQLVSRVASVEMLSPLQVAGQAEPMAVYSIHPAARSPSALLPSGERFRSRFVGRSTELAALLTGLARVRRGQGQVIAIVAEAGMGKSRLLAEFRQRVTGQAVTYLAGRCQSYAQVTPYLPLRTLVQQQCEINDTDDAAACAARLRIRLHGRRPAPDEWTPWLLHLLGFPDEPQRVLELSPQARRRRTFEALHQLFLASSQQQPLVVEVENLHWIDATSEAYLAALSERIVDTSVLLVVSYRPGYQPPWRANSMAMQLPLLPLSARDSQGIVRGILGRQRLDASVFQRIVAHAHGNPFFLEELALAVREQETGTLPGTVPSTIQAVLAARIDRLAPDAKHLLQAAAVIGPEVPMSLLQALVALPAGAFTEGLRHLQMAEFLYQIRLIPEPVYRFKHILTRETAYHSLLKSLRQRYHQQIAQVLVERLPEIVESQPELLAHHFAEAGLTTQAIDYWRRAGQRAIERGAYDEAISHFTQALEGLKSVPDASRSAEQELTVQLRLGLAFSATKGYASPDAAQAYSRAQELCQQIGTTPQLVAALTGLWAYYAARGAHRTALGLGKQLFALAQQQHDPALYLIAHRALGTELFHLGEFVAARAHVEQGMQCKVPPHRAPPLVADYGVACRCYAAWTLWFLGFPEQALVYNQQALTLAQELSDAFSLALARYFAAVLHQLRREGAAAQAMAAAAMTLSAERGFVFYLAGSTVIRGWALTAQGQREAGRAQMRAGIAAWQATKAEITQPTFLALLTEATKHPAVGQRIVAQALKQVATHGERYYEAELYRIQGELFCRQAELQKAEGSFLRALEIARHQHTKSLELRAGLSLGRLWQQQGKRAEARQLLADIYGWFTEGFDTADLKDAKALLDALA